VAVEPCRLNPLPSRRAMTTPRGRIDAAPHPAGGSAARRRELHKLAFKEPHAPPNPNLVVLCDIFRLDEPVIPQWCCISLHAVSNAQGAGGAGTCLYLRDALNQYNANLAHPRCGMPR